MNRRQFFILFVCVFIPWWVGSGLVPLLPLYAARLDASPAVVGNYLSWLFLALAAGTITGGWLAPKVRRFRELLMALATCSGVTILFMGHVTTIWQLILLSVASWLASGMSVSLVMALVGEHADKAKRGQTFSLLAMATALGGLLGGASGFVVDHWSFTRLFTLAGSIWFAQVFIAAFLTNPPHRAQPNTGAQHGQAQSATGGSLFAIPFLLVLGGAFPVSIAGFVGFLGRTLGMEANGFSNATITLIAAMGAGVGLIANPLLGRLSDRGRRQLILGILYMIGAPALILTAYSSTVTDYAIVAVLLALSGAERGISAALVSDLVPGRMLSRSLSLFDGMKWLGAVVGLAGSGYAIEQLGLVQALLWTTLLPVLAALSLLWLRVGKTCTDPVPAAQPDSALQVRQEDKQAQFAS